MRKLILKMSVSVDGFVGGPNGEIDWILRTFDEGSANWVVDILWGAGVHIMGSRTFHDMAAWWPYSDEPFAAPMNEIPKIVFSKSGVPENTRGQLTTQAYKDSSLFRKIDNSPNEHTENWLNTPVATGDLAEEITRLKQQSGKYILAHGGAGFAQSLAATGLIDEYRLVVHPTALGKGLPLFASLPNALNLKLISSDRFNSGVIANVYQAT